ncbi:MAG: DUF4097 family beta strand repeat-containing protein [Gemmatimonadaceae bacterium]
MQYSWLVALATALPLTVASGQQKVDVRHAASPDIGLRIVGGFAKLRIIGWSKDSVTVTGVLPKEARFEAYFGGSATQPAKGAKMYIEAPNDQPASLSGALEIHLPAKARVWAKSGNAEIIVESVTGSLDINIVGGSVHVTGNPRELNVESMDGGITVDGSPEWVRLKTAAGDIAMTGGSTDAAFTSVSGAIRVNDGTLDRTRFETVTGAISFAGEVARGGSFTFDTHSGTIDIRLNPKANVEVDAASLAGSIENQLRDRRPLPGREGRGQELSLTLGSGGAHMTIRSYKSNIRLGYR